MKDRTFLAGLLLRGRRTLVIGGSDEAARRVRDLRSVEAHVTALSVAPTAALRAACAETGAILSERAFETADLDGIWLCILADRDDALAERIARAAESACVFFCAIDQPAYNSFSHVAVARAGPLSIAISTNGEAPALARRLRQELERLMEESGLEAFAARLSELRRKTEPGDRAAVMERAVKSVRFTGRLEVP